MQRITLQNTFSNGLKNKPYVNSEFLVTCECLRPSEAGLIPFKNIEEHLTPADIPWPGNRIEDIGSTRLVFNRYGVFDPDTGDRISIYDAYGFTNHPDLFTPTGLCSYNVPAGPTVGSTDRENPRTPDALVKIAVRKIPEGYDGDKFEICIDAGPWEPYDFSDSEWTTVTLLKPTPADAVFLVRPGSGTTQAIEYETRVHFARPYLLQPAWYYIKTVEFGDVWFVTAGIGDTVITISHTPSNGSEDAAVSAGLKWNLLAALGRHSSEPPGPIEAEMNRLLGSVERHGGRLYVGGFRDIDYVYQTTLAEKGAASWEYFWQSFLENTEVEMTHEGMKIGRKVVFYSKLNGGDYFWPFAVEMAMFGLPNLSAFEDAVPFLLDGIRKKEIGFFEVPTNGTIERMESLDETLYIFCTDGVYAAVPQQTDFGTGHAVFKVTDVPVHNRAAAINVGAAIYYVSANDKLCVITSRGLQVLDYAIQLKTLEDVIQMDYDFEDDELYISGSNRCFVMTRTGLGEYGAPVSSVVSINGELVGYRGEQPSVDHGGGIVRVVATVCTETIDFMERMLKDIHSLELGLSNAVNIQARIHFRVDRTSTWQTTGWFEVYDTSGFTTPIVSGHDLRIELRFEIQGFNEDDYTRLEYLNAIWKRGDKRNFRLHHRRGV